MFLLSVILPFGLKMKKKKNIVEKRYFICFFFHLIIAILFQFSYFQIFMLMCGMYWKQLHRILKILVYIYFKETQFLFFSSSNSICLFFQFHFCLGWNNRYFSFFFLFFVCLLLLSNILLLLSSFQSETTRRTNAYHMFEL